jgi:LysR family glycine cleavage system transcriptional activator
MRRDLPPLTALRAFEAAARLLSFTRAADELAVTQAAVSHQIKGLEEWLGVLRFQRMPRRLVLTEAGRELRRPCATPSTHRGGRVADAAQRRQRPA